MPDQPMVKRVNRIHPVPSQSRSLVNPSLASSSSSSLGQPNRGNVASQPSPLGNDNVSDSFPMECEYPKTYADFLKDKVHEGKLKLYSSSSPFGRATKGLSFVRIPDINNILLLLLKSNTLQLNECIHLRVINKSWRNLIYAFLHEQQHPANISALINPSTPRNELHQEFLSLAIACDLHVPLIISTLRGEFTGEYRDLTSILNTLKSHDCPESLLIAVKRVYQIGAPASFNATSPAANFYS